MCVSRDLGDGQVNPFGPGSRRRPGSPRYRHRSPGWGRRRWRRHCQSGRKGRPWDPGTRKLTRSRTGVPVRNTRRKTSMRSVGRFPWRSPILSTRRRPPPAGRTGVIPCRQRLPWPLTPISAIQSRFPSRRLEKPDSWRIFPLLERAGRRRVRGRVRSRNHGG
jgi:hypothetical protein